MKALLALVLVYTTFHVHFPSELGIPGVNVINLMVAAGFALLVVLGRGGLSFDRPQLTGALGVYFAAMVLATVLAVVLRPGDMMDDLTYLKTTLFYPLYYFLFYYGIRTRAAAWQIVVLALLLAVIAAGEAWMQALAFGIGSYQETHRAWGPFGDSYLSSNLAGVFYAMFVPVFAGLALLQRSSLVIRILSVLALLLVIGAVVFTYSRTAYAIALVALVLVAWRRGAVMLGVLMLVALMLVPLLPEGASQRVQSTQVVDEHGMVVLDESTASRPEIWAGALAMWKRSPMGVGHNRFPDEIGRYSDHVGMDAHNFFVLTLAESGVIGLLALAWLLLAIWRLSRWTQHWASGEMASVLAWGFQAMLACMLLGNLFSSFFREGALMGVFWALAASLERLTQLDYAAAREAEPDAPGQLSTEAAT